MFVDFEADVLDRGGDAGAADVRSVFSEWGEFCKGEDGIVGLGRQEVEASGELGGERGEGIGEIVVGWVGGGGVVIIGWWLWGVRGDEAVQ